MNVPKHPLPPDVMEALERGQLLEAVKRLRAGGGLGLKAAKDLIDAQARSQGRAQTAGRATAPRPVAAAGPLPPQVVHALQHGNKIEAIRLLREATGLGLKEAKDWVEAAPETTMPRTARPEDVLRGDPGLAPGEVPRTGSSVLGWVVLGLVIFAIVYAVLGRAE